MGKKKIVPVQRVETHNAQVWRESKTDHVVYRKMESELTSDEMIRVKALDLALAGRIKAIAVNATDVDVVISDAIRYEQYIKEGVVEKNDVLQVVEFPKDGE